MLKQNGDEYLSSYNKFKDEIIATVGSGTLNCIYNGFHEGGWTAADFDMAACARGAFVAVLARGIPNFSTAMKSTVHQLSRDDVTYLLLRFFSDEAIYGYGAGILPNQEAVKSLYREVLGGQGAQLETAEELLARNFVAMQPTERKNFRELISDLLSEDATKKEILALIFQQPAETFDRFLKNPDLVTDIQHEVLFKPGTTFEHFAEPDIFENDSGETIYHFFMNEKID